MPFTGYTNVSRVLRSIDEEYLGTLANRGKSKTWYYKSVKEVITFCSAVFESYAVNKYDLEDLRVDPPPDFAVKLITDLILYTVYAWNKRNTVPKVFQDNYKETMTLLKSWGDPQIIVGSETILASGLILYNKTEDDLEFPYPYGRLLFME